MVIDFSDIKRIVKGWIDRELDHKIVLRHDDPLVAPLQAWVSRSSLSTAIPPSNGSKLIFDAATAEKIPVVRVKVWETPTSYAESISASRDSHHFFALSLIVFDLDGTLVDSRHDLADAANIVLQEFGGAPHSEEAIGRMVGDGAATLVAVRLTPLVWRSRRMRWRDFSRSTTGGSSCTRARIRAFLRNSRRAAPALGAGGADEQAARRDDGYPRGFRLAADLRHACAGWRRSARPQARSGGAAFLMAQAGVPPQQTLLVGDSLVDWQTAVASGAVSCTARYGFGAHAFPWPSIRPCDFAIDEPADLVAHL